MCQARYSTGRFLSVWAQKVLKENKLAFEGLHSHLKAKPLSVCYSK